MNKLKLTTWTEQEKLNTQIPMLDLHYNPEANTITIYPAELRAWKQKLLRHLSPTKLTKYDLEAVGLCGCLARAIIEYLRTIFDDAQFYKYSTICTGAVKYNFSRSFATWPYYSGNQHYPVPAQNPDDPDVDPRAHYYDITYNRWLGKDRRLRISLLQHWINSIPETGLTLKLVYN